MFTKNVKGGYLWLVGLQKVLCFLFCILYIVWIFNNENKYICSQEMKMDDKMDVNWMYRGHHFTIYVNQTIILHMLSL